MSASWRIARVAGIDIKVHFTFLLIVFIGAMQFSRHGILGMLFGVVLILALFLCVTLHELGHSVVAQKFGVTVRQIVLLPIGGVAMLSHIPRHPGKELAIAVAGPLVNVVIAGAITIGYKLNTAMGRIDPDALLSVAQRGPSLELLVFWLWQANIWLVLFNLIPAFPLDGGRMLRALLSMKMGYIRGTRAAAVVGQVLAIGLGTFGLMTGNIILAIIAAFIFFGAAAENAEGLQRNVLASRMVGDAYNRNGIVLSPFDPLSMAVRHILTSYQPDFAITRGDELVGVVTRQDIIAALQQRVGDVPVQSIMQQNPLRVDSRTTLDEVRSKMNEASTRIAAVYEDGRYLGLVSAEDIAEAFAVLQFIAPATNEAENYEAPSASQV